MNTSHYFDTSALLKLYRMENGSVEATDIAQDLQSIPLSFIGEIELRNSLQVLFGRKVISKLEMAQALECIERDIRTGRLRKEPLEQESLEEKSLRLSHDHSSELLCRSLDVLHVASANLIGSTSFVTCDKRQALLAGKAGLKVVFIDLNKTRKT